ncbi:MAG: hypothetical protein M3P18_14265 [Actinomycetota bacterium]|nr:hypothetical protein [Actinomycetota bacterium]
MLLSLMYLVIRMLLRMLVPDGARTAKDLEIVVLSHDDHGDVPIHVTEFAKGGRKDNE